MHELRLVAVSEDGAYLVLASTGRGTRFMLPVDDRLRAAVRGQFSRLGQYEIEVENPLRPKEIQARIRSGETAEAISEISGIPIERVRWFEGPVLQEREYIAQQAQRATVRPHGDAAPGPSLEDLVTKRIGAHQLQTGDATWDSWKREDRSWQLRLVYLHGGEERIAHWLYEPRHNSVTPADEEAASFSSAEPVDPVSGPGPASPGANVTPFTPRRTEVPVDPSRMGPPAPTERQPDPAGPRRLSPGRDSSPHEEPRHPANDPRPAPDQSGAPLRDDRRGQPEEFPAERPSAQRRPVEHPPEGGPRPHPGHGQPREPAQRREETTASREPAPTEPAEPAARHQPRRPEAPSAPDWLNAPPAAPEPEAEPPSAPPAAEQRSGRRRRATIDLNDTGASRTSDEQQPPASTVPAAASGDSERSAPKRKGRNRRASVPSWDEIMFGSKKSD